MTENIKPQGETMTELKIATTADIVIEKGVDMPRSMHHRGKYPFREMEVGDSFLFPAGHHQNHYYGMAREFTGQCLATGLNRTFKVRKTPDGYRCWRMT